MSKLEQVEQMRVSLSHRTREDQEVTSALLLLFQTNAEQQTKIQDLQDKLSKVGWLSPPSTRAPKSRAEPLLLRRRPLAQHLHLATKTRVGAAANTRRG